MILNILFRTVLFCCLLVLFSIQQGSLALLIHRKDSEKPNEWLSVTLLTVLLPYGLSFLSEVWSSSFTTGGKWRKWPHWRALILGCLASIADSYMTTCLFWSLLPKLPVFLLFGVLNSVLLFSMISREVTNENRICLRHLHKLLLLMFVVAIVGCGLLIVLSDKMVAKDSALIFIFLLILSLTSTPKFQVYIHSIDGSAIQNSALLCLFLKIITCSITLYALNVSNSVSTSDAVRTFFKSVSIPSPVNMWLCVILFVSSLICQASRYFRTASIKSKYNVDIPINLSSVFLTIIVSLLFFSAIDFAILPFTECFSANDVFSSDIYIIQLYSSICVLLIMPIIVNFITVDNANQMEPNIFTILFTSQYLLSSGCRHFRNDDYRDLHNTKGKSKKRRIFICSTMYQESQFEMNRLLACIKHVSSSNKLTNENVILESHIFLDNGANDENVKQFGLQLLGLVEKHFLTEGQTGVMLYTPYGIQISWKLESGLPLFIHLKDTSKVKAKKRWSQVMYMNYVLNYRVLNLKLSTKYAWASWLSVESDGNLKHTWEQTGNSLTVLETSPNAEIIENRNSENNNIQTETKTIPYFEIFVGGTTFIENLSVKQDSVIPFSSVDTTTMCSDNFKFDCNNYILATDADMTFNDDSILDCLRMCEADKDVGAVCGRTRPVGMHIHPVIWLQMFDYAKDFWIMKSSQNVIGSIMCCPGCFSLYKLDALRDIVDDYSGPVKNMEDVFTKDTGEDRWMCTLMMLKGWKLRYSSNARNTTFCPEDTAEFMKQRRRWLLSDYANTVLVIRKLRDLLTTNDAFSALYVLYTLLLFLIMLLYPASTIVMLCFGLELATGAPLVIVTPVIMAVAFCYCLMLLSECPVVVEMVITKILILVSGVGTVYILVSSLIAIFNDFGLGSQVGHFEHPEGFLLLIVLGCYMYGALLYPSDMWILLTLIVYLFYITFMNIILPLYAICNIVDQSWGTRENQKASVPKFLHLPKIKRRMKKRPKPKQVDTTILQSLSASSLSDLNQNEYDFWDELVSGTIGVNVSKGISDIDKRNKLQIFRKKVLIIFFSANAVCIVALVGLYAFLVQRFNNNSTFIIVMGFVLGLAPLIQISGSTVYRIDDILTRIGRWVSEK